MKPFPFAEFLALITIALFVLATITGIVSYTAKNEADAEVNRELAFVLLGGVGVMMLGRLVYPTLVWFYSVP
jgi:uncharacterized protein (DUF697 family)